MKPVAKTITQIKYLIILNTLFLIHTNFQVFKICNSAVKIIISALKILSIIESDKHYDNNKC